MKRPIYITGYGHSGSTLVNLIVGSSNKIYSVGELFLLRNRIYGLNRKEVKKDAAKYCQCGEKFTECTLWKEIFQKINPEELYRQKNKDFLKNILNFFNLYEPKTNEEKVYKSIISSAKKIKPNVERIVESSKTLKRLMYLKELKPKVIFLIRDGRAVANSMKDGRNIIFTCLFWLIRNLLINVYLVLNNQRYMILSYDKFAKHPKKYIKKINKEFNLNIDLDDFLRKINKEQHHNIGGNAMRKKEIKEIYRDDKWKRQLPTWKKWILNVLCYIPNKLWVYDDKD